MAILKPKEITERSGVTVLTLQRWDNNGTLKAYCYPMLKVLFLIKQLLKEVMDNQVDTIFITYKDRFIRFGYDWFERLCKMHNTEIVVLNNIETSPTQEMIDDMISIVHVFSCRLYGLRKYKSKLKNDRALKSGENNDSSSKSKTLSRSNNEEGS
ncbi:recombinase family protein [Ligilactobacillus murinus]|uniref:recombinase family protein n=1 Tax=Ligilactobacillus murinus TaxID=1622 RepID=UPI00096D47ED|nr:recombinase family protein [Ligilactobacillus murinus]